MRTAREAFRSGESDTDPRSQAELERATSLTASLNQIRPFGRVIRPMRRTFIYKPKEAVGNDRLFRATPSGTQRALTELGIDNPNKGETMDTLLIVLVVLLLVGGGGWGFSRWRR